MTMSAPSSKGTLQRRRTKTVIDYQPCVGTMRNIAQRSDIVDLRQWVRRRFQEQHARIRTQRLRPSGRLRAADERNLDAKARQPVVE
jgi:hypothetical protein